MSAAKLHAVANAVRDERAGLIVPAHPLYNQRRLLAGRGEAFSPIYVTPKGDHGARRCTVAGNMNQRPPQTPPATPPSAMYTSPYMMKQFAEMPQNDAAHDRPRTATATAMTKAWQAPLDMHANQMLYARHRAAGHGWRDSLQTALSGTRDTAAAPAGAVDYLDVEAEQWQQMSAASNDPEEDPNAMARQPAWEPTASQKEVWDRLLGPQTEAMPDLTEGESEEVTPPPSAKPVNPFWELAAEPQPPPSTAGRAARRSLQMRDAANFYEGHSAVPPSMAVVQQVQSRPVCRPMSAAAATNSARARALEAQRSDIFGHGIEGRGHWSVGPRVAERIGPKKP